jgi:hypothetical protein
VRSPGERSAAAQQPICCTGSASSVRRCTSYNVPLKKSISMSSKGRGCFFGPRMTRQLTRQLREARRRRFRACQFVNLSHFRYARMMNLSHARSHCPRPAGWSPRPRHARSVFERTGHAGRQSRVYMPNTRPDHIFRGVRALSSNSRGEPAKVCAQVWPSRAERREVSTQHWRRMRRRAGQ